MKMEPDEFESELGRQPLRGMPTDWRREILSAAGNVRSRDFAGRDVTRAATRGWWRELLWPCPQAWAGLAAVWVVILLLDLTSHDAVPVAKSSKSTPAPEFLMALREHRRLLGELIGSRSVATPPKSPEPGPRSEILQPMPTV
jgi:hypothetical protein